MFENVDGRTDAGVTGILIAHLGAFGSGELKNIRIGPPLPKLSGSTHVDSQPPLKLILVKVRHSKQKCNLKS